MRGGPWFIATLLAVAPLLLIYARLHDKPGWQRWWANVWVVVSYGLEWLRWRLVPALYAGCVLIAWWVRRGLKVRVHNSSIRQEAPR